VGIGSPYGVDARIFCILMAHATSALRERPFPNLPWQFSARPPALNPIRWLPVTRSRRCPFVQSCAMRIAFGRPLPHRASATIFGTILLTQGLHVLPGIATPLPDRHPAWTERYGDFG